MLTSAAGRELSAGARAVAVLIVAAFSIQTVLVYFYIPWRLLTIPPAAVVIIGVLAVALAWFLARAKGLPLRIGPTSSWLWLFGIITLGSVLRLFWVYAFPGIQTSDYLDYWQSAERLVQSREYYSYYGDNVFRAFRPVGFPLLLAAGIWGVGPMPWLPAAINLLLFILTGIVLFVAIRQLVDSSAALFGVFLLAISPELIAQTGYASSEPLALFLYFSLFWAVVRVMEKKPVLSFLVGLLLGLATLARTEFQLLLLLFCLYFLVFGRHWRPSLMRGTLLALGMLLVLLPWVVRNYVQLDTLLVGTTNAGITLYQANNPLAWGGDMAPAELGQLLDPQAFAGDEVAWNRAGISRAMAWIANNRARFLQLAVVKQAILFANGAVEVEWVLKGDYGYTGFWYYVTYGVGHLWWCLLWLLIGASVFRYWRSLVASPPFILLMTMTLYYAAIFSVLVSQPRHHVPVVGFLIVIASLWVRRQCAPGGDVNDRSPLSPGGEQGAQGIPR